MKVSKILSKYLLVDIVILIPHGFGLMLKLKGKLLEAGQVRLTLWKMFIQILDLNFLPQVLLIIGGWKKIILNYFLEFKKLLKKINLNLLEVLGLNLMVISLQVNQWLVNFYMVSNFSKINLGKLPMFFFYQILLVIQLNFLKLQKMLE